MKFKEFMIENFPIYDLNKSIEENLNNSLNYNYEYIPVKDNSNKFLGLITKNDLLKIHFNSKKNTITDISKYIINENAKVEQNQKIKSLDKIPKYPLVVINKNKSIKGIVPPNKIASAFHKLSQELKNELDIILKSSRNGIIVLNKEGKIKIINEAASNILQTKINEAIGQDARNILVDDGLLKVLETGEAQIAKKFKINDTDVISNRTPMINNGEIIGAIGIFQDISDLESISDELAYTKNLNRELDTIIEGISDGLYITDGDGYTTRINSTYEKITGIKAEEVMGKHMKELVEEGYYSESVTLHVLEEKKPVTISHEIKTGKEVMVTGTPVFNDNDEIIRVVTTVRDMEALSKMKKELQKSKKLNTKYYNEIEQLRSQQLELDDFVIHSKKMQEIIESAIRSGQFNSTVLIKGESGVGKEIIAKTIHKSSQAEEKTGSLIKVNCGAIPENLLESELFGYEKGAFTGAKKQGKPGMFELAENGTLFLDEIGELPLKLQVKLLRALQEREIIRVGGTEHIKINTRIIAATNQNLENLIEADKFRKDLYYRLNVIPINIPPLRKRKSDIGPLCRFFLNKFNKRFKTNKKLSLDLIDLLENYDWPGNVRQLKNIIERLVVMVEEDIISIKHLPSDLKNDLNIDCGPNSIKINNTFDLKTAVNNLEKEIIKNAMEMAETTREISSLIGVSQPTVVRKINKYNLK
ncbi:MAG TPA: sigma 54-interacting transcriptional regulator [Halanaerobiales bacterium]|nr:sigma 54-interacting transcriptional regulator [Halanaerobiales bacterium]